MGGHGGWVGAQYCGKNVCDPTIQVLKPNAQYDSVKRWGLWEVIRS